VVLSSLIAKGLKQYMEGAKPKIYLFNGKVKGEALSHSAVQQSFKLAIDKCGIQKDVCVHSLRHSFATHLLEQGVDLLTIRDQLGHANIQTTLMYLHVAQIDRTMAHSPFDRLYNSKPTTETQA
jgi:site-specific recombinase XerD